MLVEEKNNRQLYKCLKMSINGGLLLLVVSATRNHNNLEVISKQTIKIHIFSIIITETLKYTWFAFCIKFAKPQSERWGLSSASSNMLDDLTFLWTTDGEHTSCKYLKNITFSIRQLK